MKRDPFVYCGEGQPKMYPAWSESGFSPCFVRTYAALLLFAFAFVVCGVAGGVPVRRPYSSTQRLQPLTAKLALAVSCLMALLYLVHAVGHTAMAGPVEVIIVCDSLLTLAWLFSLLPLFRARNHRQPLPPVSAIFWALAWVELCMEISSVASPHWFFRNLQHPPADGDGTVYFDLVLFIVHASCMLTLMFLVLQAIHRRWPAKLRLRRGRGALSINDNRSETGRLLSSSSSDESDVPDDETLAMEEGGAAAVSAKAMALEKTKAKTKAARREERGQRESMSPSLASSKTTSAADLAGAAKAATKKGRKEERAEGSVKQRTGTTFGNLKARAKMLWPFIWPRKNLTLQIHVLLCLGLLIIGRVVNLYVPLSYKAVVDKLTPSHGASPDNATMAVSGWRLDDFWGPQGPKVPFPWPQILIYVALNFLSGSGGVGMLNNLRSFLWIPVQQYTGFESRVDTFTHLHDLSLRWHLSRKTGEVLRMVDRGTDSINSLLSYIIFNIAPTLADIAIACVYFTTSFGPYFGLIVLITMMLYIYFTIAITEWRTKFRRGTNTRDNKLRQQAIDSLINFETVKYYNGEEFEIKRYKERIMDFQLYGWRSSASLNLLNVIQSFVIVFGMVGGTMLCGYMVSQGELTVGDFVLFISYIVQLYSPLNYFGTYYRMIQGNLIDMENMLDLINIKPEIEDAPDALPLSLSQSRHGCSIEFRNVNFSYNPERQILHNVSFKLKPGRLLGIVGGSGSGKTTIMRLLFRFYDLGDGDILVNGQTVKKLTQKSLRQAMGVVPQDTVLFNETIRFNIRYGRPDATFEEVVEAAKAAEIHESILSFPDGYDTVVGERGLKLSGGEKQRIAIARCMLKAPQIVLLDEATSALDTHTERAIQTSLHRVCHHRTTIAIAHRLSTISNADDIIVLHEGRIVEQGTHNQLLNLQGRYFAMWRDQQEAEEAMQRQGFSGDDASSDEDHGDAPKS